MHLKVRRSTIHGITIQLSLGYYRAHNIVTYYEGNNNNLRTVDATSVSRSNGVMSAHHSRTVCHKFESDSHCGFKLAPPGFSSTTTASPPSVVESISSFDLGFESLKVVRFEREAGEDGWSVIAQSLSTARLSYPSSKLQATRKAKQARERRNEAVIVVAVQARTRAGNNT